MQIADVDVGLDYCFAIELQQNAQHAVCRRMLRPHVEDHRFCWTRSGLNCSHSGDSLVLISGGLQVEPAPEFSVGPPLDNPCEGGSLPNRRAIECAADRDALQSACQTNRISRARASPPSAKPARHSQSRETPPASARANAGNRAGKSRGDGNLTQSAARWEIDGRL